jgi:hypothetical protein
VIAQSRRSDKTWLVGIKPCSQPQDKLRGNPETVAVSPKTNCLLERC